MDDTQVIQPRQQPRTWVVVALTLGSVLLLGLVFGAGFAVGRSTGDGRSAASGASDTAAPAPTSAPTSGGADAGTNAGALDECVVGTWRTTEHSESVDTEQGQFSITGVERTVEITPDGTETVTYDGTPAQLSVEAAEGEAIMKGTVTYAVSTSGGTMSFQLKDVDGTLTIRAAGKDSEQELKPGSGPVQYTCDGDSFTQTATGYRSVMERVE